MKINKLLLVVLFIVLINVNCFAQQESSAGFYDPDTGEYSWLLTSPNITQSKLDQKRIDSIQNYTQKIERAERAYYISKGERETIFVPEQILSVFDNFIVKSNGEIEVFNYVISHDPIQETEQTAAEFNVISMGFVQGKLSTIPNEDRNLKILKVEDGNFRRKNLVNEITLYNPNNENKKSQYFLLVKTLKKGSVKTQYPETDMLVYQKNDDILVTLYDSENDIFKNNFDNLPDNNYIKLSCDGDCSSLWYINSRPEGFVDKFLIGGSFRTTSETSGSLNGAQTNNQVNIKFDLGGVDFENNKVLGQLLFSPDNTSREYAPDNSQKAILKMHFSKLRNTLEVEGIKFETNNLNLYVIDDPRKFNDYYVWGDYMKVDITNINNIEDFIFSAYEFYPNMNYSLKNAIFFHKGGTDIENRFLFLSQGLLKFFKSGFSIGRCDSEYVNSNIYFASACYSLDNNHLVIRPTSTWPTKTIPMRFEFYPSFQERYIIDFKEISDVYNGVKKFPNWEHIKERHVIINSPYSDNFLGYLNLEEMNKGVLSSFPVNSNWAELNLGVSSLKMWVFDYIFHKARLLECGYEGCKLDGHMISSPRTYINCKSNEDCKTAGEICINSLCVNAVEECKEYKIGSSNHKILFIGMDFTDDQLKSKIDEIFREFNNVHVFGEHVNKFNVQYKAVGFREFFKAETFHLDKFNTRLIERIYELKCKGYDPDIIVFITPQYFRSWAYNKVVALSTLDVRPSDHISYVLAHELGHVFGLADEYYNYGDPSYTGINCPKDYNEALKKWGDLLGDEGRNLAVVARDDEDFWGCGAGCEKCLRPVPNMDTLMGENYSPGSKFSKVAEVYLEKHLRSI